MIFLRTEVEKDLSAINDRDISRFYDMWKPSSESEICILIMLNCFKFSRVSSFWTHKLNLQVDAALILALAFSKSNCRGKVTAKRPTDKKKCIEENGNLIDLRSRRHLTTEVDSELMCGSISDRNEFIELFLHWIRKMSFAKIGID